MAIVREDEVEVPDENVEEQPTEATEVTETPAAPEAEEEDEKPTETTFDGITTVLLQESTRKQRGKEVYLPVARPVFDVSPAGVQESWNKIVKLASWIGLGNFITTVVQEVFSGIATDASEAGYEGDTLDQLKYWEAFRKGFDARERKKSGPTLKVIGERLVSLATEVMELFAKLQSGTGLTEAETNRVAQIKIEQLALTEAKAKKERRGKVPKAEKAEGKKSVVKK